MRLDIRYPIGLLFSIFGALLTLFGALSNKQIYERSLGININLWWGVLLLLFGAVMLLLGRRGGKHHSQPASSRSTGNRPNLHD